MVHGNIWVPIGSGYYLGTYWFTVIFWFRILMISCSQHCVRCQLACCAHVSTQWGRWDFCCIAVLLLLCPCLYTVGQMRLLLYYCTTTAVSMSLHSGAGEISAVLLYYYCCAHVSKHWGSWAFWCITVLILLCPCLYTMGQVRLLLYCCTTTRHANRHKTRQVLCQKYFTRKSA